MSALEPRLDAQTFIRLEKLSRKAANDSLRVKGGHLADDQFDSLAMALFEVGRRAFLRFDPDQTVSDRDGASYAYRAMRGYRQGRFTEGPYVDWIRKHIRDSRFEPDGTTALTETGVLPDSIDYAQAEELAAVVDRLAPTLSERDAWTLQHIATALAQKTTLEEVCKTLLADLADALRPQVGSLPQLEPNLDSFEAWFKEAA